MAQGPEELNLNGLGFPCSCPYSTQIPQAKLLKARNVTKAEQQYGNRAEKRNTTPVVCGRKCGLERARPKNTIRNIELSLKAKHMVVIGDIIPILSVFKKEINFRRDLGGVDIEKDLFSFRKAVSYSHVIEFQPLEALATHVDPPKSHVCADVIQIR